ncbi:ribonuclease H-like domain-containing protein [Tanacetum coccineum]|uniref:Ribonuclease H-like domain-containing protein n=1 Tax=Tanacetum coccineum TaxID=301880 RepID=A0ABQ5D2K9_9ASTR
MTLIFVRDMVTAGHVCVLHVPSRVQYADIFTKGLPTALFEDFRSNWAGCPTTRRSTSGYYVFLGNNLGSPSDKLLSLAPMRKLRATLVYCDNVSVVYMSSNPVQHQRTKYIEIDIHFVRDQVAAGHVRVLHVPSRYQFADIFTKGLPYALFDDFRSSSEIRILPLDCWEVLEYLVLCILGPCICFSIGV